MGDKRITIDPTRKNAWEAHAIGANACGCGMVHFDLVDKHDKVIATAAIDFEQWHELCSEVDHGIVRIERKLE